VCAGVCWCVACVDEPSRLVPVWHLICRVWQVIIDELGRGTSTFDGHAIAYAVLLDLLQRVRCRTLLSTHYHGLVQDFRDDERIVPMHMACKVEPVSQSVFFNDVFPCECSSIFPDPRFLVFLSLWVNL
jgi:hypothetical protein